MKFLRIGGGWEQLEKQLPTLWDKKEFQERGRGSVKFWLRVKYSLELGGRPVENSFCNPCEPEYLSGDWIGHPEVTVEEDYPLLPVALSKLWSSGARGGRHCLS